MENLNINDFMEQIEKELSEEMSTIEEKQNQLIAIEGFLQKIEIMLRKIFIQKSELEKDLRAYEEQQNRDNERYINFVDFYSSQLNLDDSKK